MTGLDELLRTTLAEEASTQAPPIDLAGRSMRAGRRIRRRRQVGLASASVVSVAAVVVGSLAVAGAAGGHAGGKPAVVRAGGHPSSGPSSGLQPGASPWWQTWSTDRVYGSKPSQGFLSAAASGDPSTLYASGTMTDGTDFMVAYNPKVDSDHVPDYVQGWDNTTDFGQTVAEGPTTGADAQYLTVESPTLKAHQQVNDASQWLIIVARPGTTDASYSADGTSWQPMDVEHGIAALRLPALAPRTSQVRLSDDSGQYVSGPLALP